MDDLPIYVLGAMTIELACSPWAGNVSLHVVGFASDLPEAFPDRVRHSESTVDVLNELEARPTRDLLSPTPQGDHSDPSPSVMLFARLTHDDYCRLLRLVDTRPDLTVVAALPKDLLLADCNPSWLLDADKGQIKLGNTELAVEFQGLSSDQLDRTVEDLILLRHEREERADRRRPAAHRLPRPREHPRASAGVEVRILGEVQVVGVDGPLKDRGKRARLTELIVYLACHPGAHRPAIIDAIWPCGASRATFNAAVSRARAWLGHDINGRPNLPEYSEEDGYRLSESVRLDWAEFQEHVRRAVRADGNTAIKEISKALALVRDRPFCGVDRDHYEWAELSLVPFMVNTISEQAHDLAQRLLTLGDHAGARETAAKGLVVDPLAPYLWCDMLEASSADRRAVRSLTAHYRRSCADLDIPPSKDVIKLAIGLLGRIHKRTRRNPS